MKRWRHALLLFELFLFALILVLPQVDLPDFTFPGGTAPIVAKARLSSAPVFSAVPGPIQAGSPRGYLGEARTRLSRPAVYLSPMSPVSLCCILRC